MRLSKIVLVVVVMAVGSVVLFHSPMPAVGAPDAGADLFKSKCAMCHGPDGSGNTAMGKKLSIPPLSSPAVQKETDAALSDAITKGKNKMKGFTLEPDQVKQLVAFIRNLKK